MHSHMHRQVCEVLTCNLICWIYIWLRNYRYFHPFQSDDCTAFDIQFRWSCRCAEIFMGIMPIICWHEWAVYAFFFLNFVWFCCYCSCSMVFKIYACIHHQKLSTSQVHLLWVSLLHLHITTHCYKCVMQFCVTVTQINRTHTSQGLVILLLLEHWWRLCRSFATWFRTLR